MIINALEAILLGLVQGLTEFLPVSSSGHLVITQHLFGITDDVLVFDIFVHLGTLVAVIIAFRSDLLDLIRKPFCKFTLLIIIGTIPAALMGYFLDDIFAIFFGSLIAVAIALIITGIFLFISDRFNGHKTVDDMRITDALVIGTFQGLAITPGLSRSGSTIFGALLCGLKRSEAARFSFILSIPIIIGAAIKEISDTIAVDATSIEWTYFLGAAVAALSGFFAIKIFLKLLAKKNLKYFSIYVWLVALALLIIN